MLRRYRKLAPELVTVPAGAFLMGSTMEQLMSAALLFGVDPECLHIEVPQHTVEVPGFQISRYPVTCADYLAFVTATDHHPTPAYWRGDEPPYGLADHPVVQVSMDDARLYCQWLSAATGLTYRLPSEVEWERAARGDDGRIFPWGYEWDSTCCNTAEGGPGGTMEVGACPQDISPYGCLDMAGNVEEWTGSRYTLYPGSTLSLPMQEQVMVRGGCWNNSGDLARCASRRPVPRKTICATLGFRVVCIDE